MNSKFFFLPFRLCVTFVFLIGISGCDKLSFLDFGSKDGQTADPGKEEAHPQEPPPPSPSIPQSRVWYVSEDGNDSHTGTDSSSMLASVPAALSRIRAVYRSGNWPAGESAVIIIKGRIIAPRSLGGNESMVEVTGAGNYPPIVLQGDPVAGGILDVNRKKNEDGQVLLITNNKVTLGEKLVLTGANQLWGGAVCIGTPHAAGEFIMAGGEISGNTGASGGAVMIYQGSMTMSGGVIKNNRNDYTNGGGAQGGGAASGGGVYVNGQSTFTMTGGIIESNGDNSHALKGGGVFIEGEGTMNMSGGEIRGNTSVKEGGGVYIGAFGTFNMSGGLITGNTSKEGGGVYASLYGGTFNHAAGEVKGNIPS
ncbi:MAG: hypothetical protein LBG27_09205 [Spirochaetaceae bacterium]|nr:hypothetical protein [Spirochaetaceae bacterium]